MATRSNISDPLRPYPQNDLLWGHTEPLGNLEQSRGEKTLSRPQTRHMETHTGIILSCKTKTTWHQVQKQLEWVVMKEKGHDCPSCQWVEKAFLLWNPSTFSPAPNSALPQPISRPHGISTGPSGLVCLCKWHFRITDVKPRFHSTFQEGKEWDPHHWPLCGAWARFLTQVG